MEKGRAPLVFSPFASYRSSPQALRFLAIQFLTLQSSLGSPLEVLFLVALSVHPIVRGYPAH